MKKYLILAVLLVAAVHCRSVAQTKTESLPTDTLARYGPNVITAQDFLERFELMPWPLKDNKSRIEYTKQEFLRSLVAEKVLALEAQRLGYGTDSATLAMQYSLQRLFTRDEVYKREVQAKIRVTEPELREGLKRYAFDLRVVVYGLVSKKEGDLLLKKMAASKNKQKTFEMFRDSLYSPIDTLTVSLGSAERHIEDAAYALKPGVLSQPMQIGTSGWMMLQVIDKYTNPKYEKQSLQDQFSSVRTLVSRRHEDSLATRTFADFLSPQRAEANVEIFSELADSVLNVMKNDSANHYQKNLFQFTSEDCERLERNFGERCAVKFVMMDSGDLTLGDVINGLKYNQVVFPSLKPSIVQAILNNNIKTVIQNELLAREGMKRNYQQAENVRHDVGVWMDNRKGKLLLKAVSDTVTVADTEVAAYYEKVKAEERSIREDSVKYSYAAMKLNIARKLLEEKRKRTLNAYIGGLATKYRVSMDNTKLQQTKTTTTSMVTWRTIGFGGRIIAVPMMSLQSDWVREMQPTKIINQ